MARFAVLVLLVLATAGCSSQSSSAPTATPISAGTKTYTDPTYNFSFNYPKVWQAPKKGQLQPDRFNYIVRLRVPGNVASVEVEVSGHVPQLPKVTDGELVQDPNGPDKFQYFNVSVSGRPGLRVLRLSKGVPDELATFVNVGHHQFIVRTITGSPPFTEQAKSGYNTIVRTLQLPFSS